MIDSISLWHQRLGHIGLNSMKRMISHGMISCKINDFLKCEFCVKSKMIKKSFKSVDRSTNLLTLIHSNICELNGLLTRGENIYFITFIDYYSRYTYVYLLKHKDVDFAVFKNYKEDVENQLDKKIKILRSDRGGEYFPREFNKFHYKKFTVYRQKLPTD